MPTTEIYTLSLHDALPICGARDKGELTVACHGGGAIGSAHQRRRDLIARVVSQQDRKSTRLNSSHVSISYAVFCLKKKTEEHCPQRMNVYGGGPDEGRLAH